jgi:uncharacterized protein YjbI with pentapeptide repeats
VKDEPAAFENWVVNGDGYDYVSKIEERYWVKAQEVAPARPEAKGQVARAAFVLTGQLDPAWTDWSDLQPLSDCRADGTKLENVTFANSILSGCSFQGASLSHVDLSGIEMHSGSFEGAQLSDVATRSGTCLSRVRAWRTSRSPGHSTVISLTLS